jgi:ubiquinone/menaquinone biosynthesis C-methylase UbiE
MATQHDPEGVEIEYLHQIAPVADAYVLEVGCGDGRLTWRFADSAKYVIGTDPDPSRLLTAQRECPPALGSGLTLAQVKAEALPFPAAKFDLAILAWSL